MEQQPTKRRLHLAALFNLFTDAVSFVLMYTLIQIGITALGLPSLGTAAVTPLPLWLVFSAMLLGLGVNLRLRRTQRRRLGVLVFNLVYSGIFMFAAVLIMSLPVKSSYLPSLRLLFSAQAGLANLFSLWLALLILALAGIRTYQISGQNPSAAEALTRFELSIATLFGLTVLFSLLGVPLPGGIPLLFAGFLASGVSLSLAPNLSLAQKPLWLGPLALVSLLFPIAFLGPLVLPYLSSPAGTALEVAHPILSLLKELFLRLLILLLSWGHMVPEASMAKTEAGSTIPLGKNQILTEPAWMNKVGHGLLLGTGALLFLGVLILLSYFMYRIIRHLLAFREPQPNASPVNAHFSWWRRLLYAFGPWLRALRLALARKLLFHNSSKGVLDSYQALLYWGKKHRYPRKPFETPHEYLRRLSQNFPSKTEPLTTITKAYVTFAYGRPHANGTSSEETHGLKLREALQNLYHH